MPCAHKTMCAPQDYQYYDMQQPSYRPVMRSAMQVDRWRTAKCFHHLAWHALGLHNAASQMHSSLRHP
jgi:hypothetical protein